MADVDIVLVVFPLQVLQHWNCHPKYTHTNSATKLFPTAVAVCSEPRWWLWWWWRHAPLLANLNNNFERQRLRRCQFKRFLFLGPRSTQLMHSRLWLTVDWQTRPKNTKKTNKVSSAADKLEYSHSARPILIVIEWQDPPPVIGSK